jgi:hypothetical protein
MSMMVSFFFCAYRLEGGDEFLVSLTNSILASSAVGPYVTKISSLAASQQDAVITADVSDADGAWKALWPIFRRFRILTISKNKKKRLVYLLSEIIFLSRSFSKWLFSFGEF